MKVDDFVGKLLYVQVALSGHPNDKSRYERFDRVKIPAYTIIIPIQKLYLGTFGTEYKCLTSVGVLFIQESELELYCSM